MRRGAARLTPLPIRFERLHDPLEDLGAGEPLAVRRDEEPGRGPGVGPLEHLVDRLLVLVPLLAVAPVVGADLPVLVGVLLALLEAPELLLFRDVEEDLDHRTAVVGELLFELVDLVVGAAPLVLRGELLDPLDEHPAVPGAVEHRDLARTRKLLPEPPEVMARLLVRARRRDRVDLEAAGVEFLREPADRAAFPRGVPALERDDRPPLP